MSAADGARVLIIDDETAIRRVLRTNLKAHGFRVEEAETGETAVAALQKNRPDLIILDLGLPDMEGAEVIRIVRAESDTPIIVLSVRGAERDKVQALDLGADDYLTKPFGADELLARIRVALRHVAHPRTGADAVFRSGDLEVDLERRQVRVAGDEVRLSPTEFALLLAFVKHPDKVLTDRMLLHEVWGPEYGSEDHYLHVYVARLRKKIEADPQRPRHIVTEPGVGYRLNSEPD
jgi:two-component system KDP operon response regulator KdpE